MELGEVSPERLPEAESSPLGPSPVESPRLDGEGPFHMQPREMPQLVWAYHCRRPQERVPSIRATHPRSGLALLFPLRKSGVGTMISSAGEWEMWTTENHKKDTLGALLEFERQVGYPKFYIETMLAALSNDTFPDGTQLSWSGWRKWIQFDTTRLYATVYCRDCHRPRRLAMNTLFSAPPKMPSLRCSDLMLECWQTQERPTTMICWPAEYPTPGGSGNCQFGVGDTAVL